MPSPHGRKPPNPLYVPKQHGRKPSAPKPYKSSGKSSSSTTGPITAFAAVIFAAPALVTVSVIVYAVVNKGA